MQKCTHSVIVSTAQSQTNTRTVTQFMSSSYICTLEIHTTEEVERSSNSGISLA